MSAHRLRARRKGLTTERLSQNSRDGLERVQQKTVAKNTVIRESKITTMFELDNSNIKRHLEVLCTCYLASRFNKHGIGARLRKEVINAELSSLNTMVDLMKFNYPSLFVRGIYPQRQNSTCSCRNGLFCVAWKILFSEGCSWFKLAASLEIFTLFLAANPEHQMSYPILGQRFTASLLQHSDIEDFIKKKGWTDLQNYFQKNMQEASASTDQSEKLTFADYFTNTITLGYDLNNKLEAYKPVFNALFIFLIIANLILYLHCRSFH
ncbi:Oidioi.mRNA.OKI2018_I69.PAR.g10103.t1.cds [Oikopleura dioica]|uniref:Oidioi.mRNA.OKI2018_I69.PAR.g10103.t1.cds n=1 Tax=Oikopleura dioica TaxID=34765 RepID=A0ABN7RSD7_OIKDI|nr:Oidioi.mRNA.OKI2018_I69.PAR.g10103.t1.cds [Oikopleura dioica]